MTLSSKRGLGTSIPQQLGSWNMPIGKMKFDSTYFTHIGLGPREYRSTLLSRATAAIYGMPVGFWPEDTSICEPSGKTIA
jgi:hypothetical protein